MPCIGALKVTPKITRRYTCAGKIQLEAVPCVVFECTSYIYIYHWSCILEEYLPMRSFHKRSKTCDLRDLWGGWLDGKYPTVSEWKQAGKHSIRGMDLDSNGDDRRCTVHHTWIWVSSSE